MHVWREIAKDSVGKSVHEHLDKLHRSPIHAAVLSGDSFILRSVLDYLDLESRKRVVRRPGLDGMTPLHLAVAVESVECVEELTDLDPDISASPVDIWDRGALHIAAKLGNTDIASRLLKIGACVNQADQFGKSPIAYLLQQTRKAIPFNVLIDLARESKRDNRQEKDGKSFYHIAAEVASIKTINELKQEQSGWDEGIKLKDRNGRTPLILAILARRTEIANILLESPSSATQADDSNMTALMHACANGLVSTVEHLLKRDKKAAGNQDDNGRTALHHAIQFGNEDIAEKLLKIIGFNTTRDLEGRTAFHAALDNGMDNVALSLLQLGDYEETKDKAGDSILVTACFRECVQSAKAILQKWPKLINIPDEDYGQTPLSWACEYSRMHIVRILFDCKDINPNIPESKWNNYTPLHFAVLSSHGELVDYLLEQPQVDPGVKDKRGNTPLDLAVGSGDHKLIRALCIHRPNARETIETLSKVSDSSFADLLPDILEKFEDDALKDEDLVKWFDRSLSLLVQELGNSAPLAAYLRKAAGSDAWKKLRIPCHRAAQIGEFATMKQLIGKGAETTELDDDNWSWLHYGRRYSEKSIDMCGELADIIQDLDRRPLDQPKGPSGFISDDNEEVITVAPCKSFGHQNMSCNNIIGRFG